MTDLLSLKGAGCRAGGAWLLRGVDFDVCRGERVVVLGANGAGKTTLLKLCNGIMRCDEGSVHSPAAAEQVFIFQRPPLLRRSVVDNLRFVLAIRGLVEPARTATAMSALVACGLSGFADRPALSLSAGEQQRLALARAWASEPRLLLADEPTANLAPAATREIEHLLCGLRDRGAALVVTTHNVAQAKRLADRVVFLDAGRVVEDRPAREFFVAPQSAAARRYLEGESL